MDSNFDAVAPWYERLERLAWGDTLQRCRLALLDQIADARRVLIAGEGDGRFLAALLDRHSPTEVTVVDASRRMLALVGRRIAPTKTHVNLVHADVQNPLIELPAVDLIVTCFFLDCFNERDQTRIIQRLRSCLSPNGRWLWADFAIPGTQPMKGIARSVTALLYRFFGLTTGLRTRRLADARPQLLRCGLARVEHRTFRGGLLEAALYAPTR